MSHDRVRLSALVDGELDHELRDRLLAHLAQCDECRLAVDGERQVKALLGGMPDAGPSDAFTARLFGIAANPDQLSDPAPVRRPDPIPVLGHVPPRHQTRPNGQTSPTSPNGQTRPNGQNRPNGPGRAIAPPTVRPYDHPSAWRFPHRPARTAGPRAARGTRPLVVGFAGAASFAGMALVTAFTVGGQPAPEADIRPPIERYTVQHSNGAVDVPWSDPGAVTASFNDGRFGSALFGSGGR